MGIAHLSPSLVHSHLPRGLRLSSALGGSILAVVGLLASPAMAAPVSLHVLPTGPATAGDTVELRVLALDEAGVPVEGLTLKADATAGTAGALRELGRGLYVVPVTFAADGSPSVVSLSGTADGEAVAAEATLDVQAPVAAQRLTVTVSPNRAVLGKDTSVKVEAKGAGPQGLRVRASVGEVGKPATSGDSTTVNFVPPKVNFPQVAVITAVDVGQPEESFGFAFLPLVGSVPFPVKGPAGASVTLALDGTTFGPVVLGTDGKGKVAIEVAPGVQSATQTTVNGSDTSTKTIDLGIPGAKRLGLLPLPRTIATGGDTVPLRVAVAAVDGEPDVAAKVSFSVSRGSVGTARHLGGGAYEATWTLPDTPGEVTVAVRMDGDDLQVDEGKVTVARGLLGAVALDVDPWPAEDDGTVEVTVAAEGVPVDDLRVTVLGGTAGATVPRDGGLTLTVEAVEADALQVSASVALTPSGDGVRHVVLLPASGSAAPGSTLPVLVATVDDDGLPVPGREVSLSVRQGGASLPASVETGADGMVLVTLTLDDGEDLVALRASSSGYIGEAAVVPVAGLEGSEAWATIGPFARAWRSLNPVVGPVGGGAEVVPWGAVPEPEPEPEPVPVMPFTPEPQPVAEVPQTPAKDDPPFVRLRASAVMSTYRYEQTPGTEPGDVLNRALTVGGGAGSPASPAGFEVDGRLWLDPASVPYVGVHASLRNTWYSIRSDAFDEPARDQLLQGGIDLLLRYPFQPGNDTFWLGARGGFHYDDFIYFEGCVDQPGCAVGFKPLSVPGLAVGPELGAEIGPAFVIGSYSFGLANFTQPYRHAFDLDVGLELAGPLFAEIGFGAVSRRVELVGASSDTVRGQLNDAQMLFDVGLGVGF